MAGSDGKTASISSPAKRRPAAAAWRQRMCKLAAAYMPRHGLVTFLMKACWWGIMERELQPHHMWQCTLPTVAVPLRSPQSIQHGHCQLTSTGIQHENMIMQLCCTARWFLAQEAACTASVALPQSCTAVATATPVSHSTQHAAVAIVGACSGCLIHDVASSNVINTVTAEYNQQQRTVRRTLNT
jgi:hypothetical protein